MVWQLRLAPVMAALLKTLTALALGALALTAQAEELKVMTSGGFTAAYKLLGPQYAQQSGDTLDTILNLLRQHSKHDLSLYKSSTVLRRIERRVAVHGLDTMAAYAGFLQNNPQELDLLFAEMLIGVTSFFRDPEVWEELKMRMAQELLPARSPDTPLRAWVAGGQEIGAHTRNHVDLTALPDDAAWHFFGN